MSVRWEDPEQPTETVRLLIIGVIALGCGLFLAFVVGAWALPNRSECISVPETAHYVQSTGYWVAPSGAVMGYQPDPGGDCIYQP